MTPAEKWIRGKQPDPGQDMQPLVRTLQDKDIGHLAIVAELWGIDLPKRSRGVAVQALCQAMLEPLAVAEMLETLAASSRELLSLLSARGGGLPLGEVVRNFGPLPALGPGRRDREQPWRNPSSPVEDLWYRGLIARAFADTPTGPQEFVFIPSDLRNLIPGPTPSLQGPPGQPAEPPLDVHPASIHAVDDATTILAALRRTPSPEPALSQIRRRRLSEYLHQPQALDLWLDLLKDAGILSGPPLRPLPQPARAFLDVSRTMALHTLSDAWKASVSWNDLAHTGHLAPGSGEWPNDPRLGRRIILESLQRIPRMAWWSLEGFVRAIRDQQPAFQRPGGDFDAWYLRDSRTGEFLRGFEHWDAVEGALIRFIVVGPLHWLGIADTGAPGPSAPPVACRLTPLAQVLLDQGFSARSHEDFAAATLHPDGRLAVPHLASRTLRYQLARFAAWETLGPDGYHYRLTPSSLEQAAKQGLRPRHFRSILASISGSPLPAAVERGLGRWVERGTEARLQRECLLRVSEPKVLEELRSNRSTSRYLGEALGPTCVAVRERDLEALHSAAARAGILVDLPEAGVGQAP